MSLDQIGTECAVAAVHLYDHSANVFPCLYNMLLSQCNRFNMSVGVAVYADERSNRSPLYVEKHAGDIVQGFGHPDSKRLRGSRNRIVGYSGIAHGRYATSQANQKLSGTELEALAHPYEQQSSRDIGRNFAIAFNGNIINAEELIAKQVRKGRVFTTHTDGELIKIVVNDLLHEYRHATIDDYCFIFKELSDVLDGAYCIVFNDAEGRTIAVRDPYGFRPLCYAQDNRGIFIASESTALLDLGFTKRGNYHDILPGQMVMVEKDGTMHGPVAYTQPKEFRTCLFEHVYFANVTSIQDGVSVQEFRIKAGEALGRREPLTFTDNHVITIIPETPRAYLDGYMKLLHEQGNYARVVEVLIRKGDYRSFLHDDPNGRHIRVREKFRITPGIVDGLDVVALDDSIVRGNTTKEVIQYIKEVGGARSVHVRTGYDINRNPCWMGIAMSTFEELLAFSHPRPEQIAQAIGAESVVFNDIGELIAIAKSLDPQQKVGFCTACTTGEYPTPAGQARFAIETERLGIGRLR
ncbi:hypothetical protein HYY69_08525 [Candidatus Woesearchaeota archaeon]|nr:hypothetical protein [Candidatus Woesearchaeota archaeon]